MSGVVGAEFVIGEILISPLQGNRKWLASLPRVARVRLPWALGFSTVGAEAGDLQDDAAGADKTEDGMILA
jgi:hypothetical protein